MAGICSGYRIVKWFRASRRATSSNDLEVQHRSLSDEIDQYPRYGTLLRRAFSRARGGNPVFRRSDYQMRVGTAQGRPSDIPSPATKPITAIPERTTHTRGASTNRFPWIPELLSLKARVEEATPS